MAAIISPWNDVQRANIEKELERVLTAPPFTNSQRCTSFLRHLVELTLSGDIDRIKERTLGIEVFDRPANYDMNADPIVRRIAGDTRKRLAQYYGENPRCNVRIRLDVGSYIPQFDFEPSLGSIFPFEDSTSAVVKSDSDSSVIPEVEVIPARRPVPASRSVQRKWLMLCFAALLILSVFFAFVRFNYFRSTNYLVWKPLLGSSGELIVCVSDRLPSLFSEALNSAKAKAASGQTEAAGTRVDVVAASRPRPKFIDMMTAFKITKQLDHLGREATIIPASSLGAQNLSNQPIILVGSISYPLSIMLQSRLRYTIRVDHSDQGRWIEDAQNPGNRDWKVDGAPEDAKVDYGMVTRYWDSDTGGWVMMVIGIGPFGTEAAANLVTDPVSSKLLPDSIRSAHNFQIVVKTTVIDGSAGAPQVLAVYTW
jgi:hypothetical protein